MASSAEPRCRVAHAWELEFVRLIALPVASALTINQQWWLDLVHEVPTDFLNIREKALHSDRGTVQEVMLSLSIDPTYIVWEARSPRLVDQTGYFPTIGLFQAKIGWFVDLINAWLVASCPALVRLAFSAKLLQLRPTADEAYSILADYLPAAKGLLDMTPNDFLLQINLRKPKSDAVPSRALNRVSTWSKMGRAVFAEVGKPFAWHKQGCYGALELDINTAPEQVDILPQEKLPELFKELAEIGQHIAEYGVNTNARAD